MNENLAPIFRLRILCLQAINPKFYARTEKIITLSSLAAQDYVFSGAYDRDYGYISHGLFRTLPNYIAIHQKYNLPYNPDSEKIYQNLNQGLVMDLADSFHKDQINATIDKSGNIIHPDRLYNSEVLQVYHNNITNGIPLNALTLLPKYQIEKLLALAQQKTK